MEWGAARYPWHSALISFLLGHHEHLTILGQIGTTFSDSPPFPPPLPKDNLQQQIPYCQAASQQGKVPGQVPGEVQDGGVREMGMQDEACKDMGFVMEGLGCRMDPSGCGSSLGDRGVRTRDTGRGMFDMGCGMGQRQGCPGPFWQTWSLASQAGLDPGLGGRA